MTLTATRPFPDVRPAHGGWPARRAVVRWSWRLFRREWRRQALILGLLTVAVAGTTFGLGLVSNLAGLKADPVFGTANTILSISGSDPNQAADVNAVRARFGAADVIAHRALPIPGSVGSFDIRSENPAGRYVKATLRLDSGRYPVATDEVAVTQRVSEVFGLHLGGNWDVAGNSWRVVGLVENPLALTDNFALRPAGQSSGAQQIAVLVNARPDSLSDFRLPGGGGLSMASRGTATRTASEVLVLLIGTVGLLFVGLLSVAGFAVLAQRRQRALGMLAALGASNRHVRLVMKANGAAVGISAAAAGALIGLLAWLASIPTLQSITSRRIDPGAIPWWAVGAAMALAVVTSVVAAWWPARAAERASVVAALSGRPAGPRSARTPTAAGGAIFGAGIVLLAFADGNRAGFIIGGTLCASVGLLLFAPLAVTAVARLGRYASVPVRLAVRDLSRYRGRSGSALGAITLALAIAATIAVSASAAQKPDAAGNLAPNQMVVHISSAGAGDPVVPESPAQEAIAAAQVGQIAGGLGARVVLPLDQPYDPSGGRMAPPGGGAVGSGYPPVVLAVVSPRPGGGEEIYNLINLYAATPAVLARFRIAPASVPADTDILTSRSDLSGYQIFDPGKAKVPSPAQQQVMQHPVILTISRLPKYTSGPVALITVPALERLGLQTLTEGWLLQTQRDLAPAQIDRAREQAATAGLRIETRRAPKSYAPLRDGATAAGILLGLGVLGMAIGLIRSESAGDLRVLTAAGADGRIRRALTGATAGVLAFLGATLGTAGAYAALLAWHRGDLSPLGHVPWANLALIVLALPAVAFGGGWLLAGRQPPAIARRPLE